MKNFNMILEYVPNFNYFPMPLFTNVKYNETAALARLRRIYRVSSTASLAMDDLLDLFGDRKDMTEEKDADKNAPVELMTQFLVLVSDRKMEEALALTSEILQYEPRNDMIIEYRRSLTIYIQQERDEREEAESSETEEKSSDGSDDDDENDTEDSDDESISERKINHK